MVGWDATRLSRVERGLYRVSGDEVHELCAKLRVEDPAGVEEVARVAEEPTGLGWWAPYADRIAPNYLDFIELEARAESIRIYHPAIIPGPLQTAAYAREIISRASTAHTKSQAEMLVTVRIARQSVLSREGEPVKFHALVPESALHARFGTDSGLMKNQIRSLLDASERPDATVQLLPLTAHPAYGSDGPLTIMSFRHPWLAMASVDNQLGGIHTEDPAQVNYLETEFSHIASIAYPVDESREILAKYLEGLHQ